MWGLLGSTGAPVTYLAETRPQGILGACHQGCVRVLKVSQLAETSCDAE